VVDLVLGFSKFLLTERGTICATLTRSGQLKMSIKKLI
jgi:hypothetical protein